MKIKTIITSLVTLVALGFASSRANAQEVFNVGTQTASATVGLFGTFTKNIVIPSVQLSYEYCVVDNLFKNDNGSLGVGAMGAYFATGDTNTGVKYYRHNGIIGGRALLHYQFAPQLDTYAGLFLGAYLYGSHETMNIAGETASAQTRSKLDVLFGWGLHLGVRYYLTPAFAVTGELGYGYSILNLGLTFRF